jgi:hypothetical protein
MTLMATPVPVSICDHSGGGVPLTGRTTLVETRETLPL